MLRRVVVPLLVVLLAGGTAAAARAFYSTPQPQRTMRISGWGVVPVHGNASMTGRISVAIEYPRSWRLISRSGMTLKLQSNSSCRHVVTFTPKLIQATSQDPAARAAALLPANARRYIRLEDFGARVNAAFRLTRDTDSGTIRGVLVTPAANTYTPGVPAGQSVYAQLSAVAKPNPRIECHIGAPRRIAAALGDSLAILGGVYGVVNRP